MNASPILLSTLICTALLTGCANTKIANHDSLALAAQQEASQNQLSTADIIQQARVSLTQARADDLDFYAPLHISRADEQLMDAEKLNRKAETDEEKSKAKSAAITAQKLLASAKDIKVVVERELAESLERKKIIDELDTKKLLPKQYAKAFNELTVLIKEVEGGFFDKVAEDQPKMLVTFAELEADAMREIWLKKALVMMKKADDAYASDLAEATYEKAERAIKSANAFIDNHYSDRKGVEEASFKAYNLASQAYYLAVEADQLFKADEAEIESYLLKIQKNFNTINEQGLADNLASHSFKMQAEMLASKIKKNSYILEQYKSQTNTNNVKPASQSEAETKVMTTTQTAPRGLADTVSSALADDTAKAASDTPTIDTKAEVTVPASDDVENEEAAAPKEAVK